MTLTFPGAPLASEPPITTNYADRRPAPSAPAAPLPAPRARALRRRGRARLHARRAAAREQHPAAALRPARGRPRVTCSSAPTTPRTARSRATRRTGRSASATAWPRTRCGPTRTRSPRRRGCGPGQRLPRAHGRLARRGRGGHAACATPTTAWTRGAARGASRSAPAARSSRAASARSSWPRPGSRCASTSRARTCSAELRPSDTTASCPYKGRASYWSLDGIEDVGLVLRGAAGEHAQGARPRVLRREQGRGPRAGR